MKQRGRSDEELLWLMWSGGAWGWGRALQAEGTAAVKGGSPEVGGVKKEKEGLSGWVGKWQEVKVKWCLVGPTCKRLGYHHICGEKPWQVIIGLLWSD